MPSFGKMLSCLLLLCCTACNISQANSSSEQDQAAVPSRISNYSYDVVNTFPHDPGAFTQGLVYHQGLLYESTGLNGQSSLRRVELNTGQVLKKLDVPQQFFAEGLALFNNKLYQLTWVTQTTFVYDLDSFQMLRTFGYTGEGWGLTHNGQSLIMSDGTNQIRFLDPETFQVQRTINVLDGNTPIRQLNELEFVKGEIFANIWFSDRVARIDPQTGRVNGWLDFAQLRSLGGRISTDNVLNGIAYDEAGDRLFVTGKNWPRLYEVKLVTRRAPPSR